MSQLATIVTEASSRGLRFLVIGGHAVNAHGYSRFTKDLDLLVRRTDSAAWESLLRAHGFTRFREEQAFLQFNQPPTFPWPLDLMLVNEDTFEKIWGSSQERVWTGSIARFPSLDDLFALKFHVLRYGSEKRGFKDFLDVLSLAEENSVNVRSDKFRTLCEKYGTPEIYERLLAFKLGTA